MAGRIAGITVEIGGDTTKLQTALKSVNSEIRNTESRLKDVNRLLKLDPGNTELLAQKHRLLGEAVESTKEKLKTLKTAAEQASEALKNGTITQSQYDGLQREIAETESKLKSLEEQAQQSATALQKIAATGEKLKGVGDKITGAGKALLPVSGAVTALGVAAVKTAGDFDAAMSQIKALSGASGEAFTALRDKAREMGETTKFSATDAANAMSYMAQAGWTTEQMLSGIDGVMNLAAASGEDLALTSDIVTDALTAFGLKASDAAHFADVLATASAASNTNVQMMGETFKYAAPVAGALGFSIEDTAEAIGLMSNAGIKSTQAGTALRTIFNNLSAELSITGAALGNVTIQTTNADGSMRSLNDILTDCREAFSQLSESEKVQAAETLVGKNAMSGFLALMNASPSDIGALRTALDQASGSAKEMAAVMQDNLPGQIENLKSQLEELAISFGDMLMPVVRNIVSVLQGFMNVLNGMDEGTRNVILTVGLVVAALAPVLIVTGKVISAVGTMMTLLPKLGGLIASVKTGFSALSAVLAANPIGLVIAAIAALVAAFVYLWNTSEDFRNFWIGLWENVKQVAVTVWNAIRDFMTGAWQAISQTATKIWNGIQAFLRGLWNGLAGLATSVWNGLKNTITSVWQAIASTATSVWNGIRSTVTGIWNGLKGAVLSAAGAIRDGVTGAFHSLLSGISSVISSVYTTVVDGFNRAVDFIRSLGSQAFQWGADLIGGIVDGIRSMIGSITDAVSSVAEKIRSFLHFSAPDEGPLTDYQSWMPDFMRGLASGIQRSRGLIDQAMADVAGSMTLSPEILATQSMERRQMSTDRQAATSSLSPAAGTSSSVGDIVIPVYIGGDQIDELLVSAEMRRNLRSGGR